MSAKIIITAVSVILMVGVVISVLAVVQHRKSSTNSELTPKMKAVSNFCTSASYQESCQKSLGNVNDTDPKAFVGRAILSANEAVEKFYNFCDSLIVEDDQDPRRKVALEDCKELLNYTIDSLEVSCTEVDNAELHDLGDRVSDLRTWLSAAISYQQSCLDCFDFDKALKENMNAHISEAGQLTSNALAIVTKLSSILSKFGLKLDVPTSRRLLSVERERNNYPSWISNVDRKLLAKIDNNKIKPDVVVAQDGSGKFKTITEALEDAPKESSDRHVIYVKAGIYDEDVIVDKKTINVLMYGDGPRKTVITGNKNHADGIQTFKTATFSVIGNGFIARSMGFVNTAGPEKEQAVALRVQSDKSAFFNCRMDAYQDTLYNQANRQFFRNCVISGTIDIIFGDSPTVIQNSLIIVRKPLKNQLNTVTAQGKVDSNENTGIVIQNCRIAPEQKLFEDRFSISTYLGRPWRRCSTTVIMESILGDFIQPEGWIPWTGKFYEDTLYYAEYNNSGPGASLSLRVDWKGYHKIDRSTAMRFTAQTFLLSRDNWMVTTNIPFVAGLRY